MDIEPVNAFDVLDVLDVVDAAFPVTATVNAATANVATAAVHDTTQILLLTIALLHPADRLLPVTTGEGADRMTPAAKFSSAGLAVRAC